MCLPTMFSIFFLTAFVVSGVTNQTTNVQKVIFSSSDTRFDGMFFPVVCLRSNEQVGYFDDPVMVLKIIEVKVDGASIEPHVGVCLDELHFGSTKGDGSLSVHLYSINQLICFDGWKPEGRGVVEYKIPAQFKQVDISYKIRTEEGLGDSVYAVSLKGE